VCGPPPDDQYVVGVFENPSGTTHEGYAFINIPDDFVADCHAPMCEVTGAIKDTATIGGATGLSGTVTAQSVQALLSIGEGQVQVAYSVTSAEAPASLGYTGNPFEFRFYWVAKG